MSMLSVALCRGWVSRAVFDGRRKEARRRPLRRTGSAVDDPEAADLRFFYDVADYSVFSRRKDGNVWGFDIRDAGAGDLSRTAVATSLIYLLPRRSRQLPESADRDKPGLHCGVRKLRHTELRHHRHRVLLGTAQRTSSSPSSTPVARWTWCRARTRGSRCSAACTWRFT